MSTRP